MELAIEKTLIELALKTTGLQTAEEVVSLALTELVRREQQKSLLQLKGKIRWEGDLTAWRTGRIYDDFS
ncbi:hypothetical protein THII_1086 [Thioploca ingrica]|uniref:Transcription regulator of the Arc/MetJ class n=1 Tax=Thioploca ingrica TaxID=40754 RepID=A0A090ACE1_9GAMM|nr:hypothetical protein THII_1086 [Thioploca ingrica]